MDDRARTVAGPSEEKRPEVSTSNVGVSGDAAALWQRQQEFVGEMSGMLGPRPAAGSSARGDGQPSEGGGEAVSLGGAEDFAGTFLNLDEIKGMSDDILIPTSESALRGLSMAMDTEVVNVSNASGGVSRHPSVGDFMMPSFSGHFDDQNGSSAVGPGMAAPGAASLQPNFGHASTSAELPLWSRDSRAGGGDDHMRASTSAAMYRAGGTGVATSTKAATQGHMYQFPQNTLSPDGRPFDATGLHGVGPSGTNVASSPVLNSAAAAAAAATAAAMNVRAFQMRGMSSMSNEQTVDPTQPATFQPILIPHEIECLKELLTVVGKLDAPTRTNIRDSLLRLAKNAEMRKHGNRANCKEMTAPDGTQLKSEVSNRLDREVAQLLFSNSFDFSSMPATDARRE